MIALRIPGTNTGARARLRFDCTRDFGNLPAPRRWFVADAILGAG